MEKWLDAAYPPTDAELAYFKANGWSGVAGYFKYSSTDNVLNGWADSDFMRVQAAGLKTMAYVSGYADPVWAANRAASLGIQICLDDEGGMRPDGAWVPGWLASSGAGLYGNGPVHIHAAPFHILAAYPGYDPGVVWDTAYAPKPDTPCGWQWQGSHNVDGANVDSSWFDDVIGGVFGGAAGQIKRGENSMFLRNPNGDIYMVDASGKRHISAAEWAGYSGASFQNVDASVLAAIPDAPAPPVDLSPVLTALQNVKVTVDLSPVMSVIQALQTELDSVKAWQDQPWYSRLFK